MQAGPNRISDVHLVEPQVCVCEGIRLRIEGIRFQVGVCACEGILLRIEGMRFEQRELEANGVDLGHQRIANC